MAIVEEVEVEDSAEVAEDEAIEKTEADEEVEVAAPPAPAAPEFKLSQIVPMVAMMGLQKYNLEEMGYTRHVEIGYVVVQLACFAVLYFVYMKINTMLDDGKKIKIPEVKQMGQVVTPATEQTAKEYDMAKLKEQVKQPLIGFVILGGIYYKWGSLMPLVMQILMTPMTLYEAPTTQIHLLGKTMVRPFPVPPGMFDGLKAAAAPEAAAEPAVEDKKKK